MGSDRARLALLTVFVLPACSLVETEAMDGSGEDVGQSSQDLRGSNGMSLNGMSLNGMSLNGMSLNGMSLNGMSLNGMSLNGGVLSGTTSLGEPVSGEDLVGATMVGNLAGGGSLDLRIDDADAMSLPHDDVWAYAVSYRSGETWLPLCGEDASGAILAVPLAGTWDHSAGTATGGSWSSSGGSFTLACRGAALAKCVEFGYEPWKSVSGVSLRDYHQACTRMLRADYCGDGTSWTANGTEINLYDDLGIQLDAATWHIDAEWSADGALCAENVRDFQPGSPACLAELQDGFCGAFGDDTLLIDEYGAWEPITQ
jgi:hypothetical protein